MVSKNIQPGTTQVGPTVVPGFLVAHAVETAVLVSRQGLVRDDEAQIGSTDEENQDRFEAWQRMFLP